MLARREKDISALRKMNDCLKEKKRERYIYIHYVLTQD